MAEPLGLVAPDLMARFDPRANLKIDGSHQQGDHSEPSESPHLTISEDRTDRAAIEKRNLSALCREAPEAEDDRATRTARIQSLLENEKHQQRMRETELEMEQQRKVRGKGTVRRAQEIARPKREDRRQYMEYPRTQAANRTANLLPTTVNHNIFASPSNSNRAVQSQLSQPGTNNGRLPTEEVQALREQMALLEAKLNQYESKSNAPGASRFEFLYRLGRGTREGDGEDDSTDEEPDPRIFSDPPEIAYGQNGAGHVRCNLPLRDLDLFLAQNSDISFVVFRDYQRWHLPGDFGTGHILQVPEPFSESIYPVANDLKVALDVLFYETPMFRDIQSQYDSTGEIFAPYHFLYHSRKDLEGIKINLDERVREQLDLLLKYVEENFGHEYGVVDSLLKEEKITPDYINYLFKPGDIIVEATGQDYTGYIAESWVIDGQRGPNQKDTQRMSERLHQFPTIPTNDKEYGRRKGFLQHPKTAKSKSAIPTTTKSLKAWTLSFDGDFRRTYKTLQIDIPHGKPTTIMKRPEEDNEYRNIMDEAQSICSLNVFPLEYAPDLVLNLLKRRGNTFWKCRSRRLVSYHGKRSGEGVDMTDERYMIDMETYKKLHPSDRSDPTNLPQDLHTESINEPEGKYLFLLPPYIKGYNLRHKKWFEISADGISDVKWNREAFQSLVIERKSKELIQALVTSQIEAEQATDLISGKGNGLILLLHGGPGTGKTLTAESVAEIAEKPLYRVTCGDVGTQAEQVEKYLESVLYLGRIWGCVVLLDEADVFLEQRSLEDLERNALVSVFLRVLEYYDGILVLTSNRVGTFDEAFRSRIQLALHYPSLGPEQRFRIWSTFIDRLSKLSTDEEIDIDDLKDHLSVLKEETMNGRQIRNVITTARQYAKWKKEPLTYQYLKDVIEISGRFDSYLDKLHGGFSNDEIAQDDGLRLAEQ